MKRVQVILTICVLLFSVDLSAQVESPENINPTRKGVFLLGTTTNAGLNFSNSSSESELQSDILNESKRSRFSLSGSAGYFFIDNFVAGIELSYSTSKFKQEDFDVESNSWSINSGPFISYYFDVGADNLRPYVKAATRFGFGKSERTRVFFDNGEIDIISQNDDLRNRSFIYSVQAGVAFFLNNTIAINVEAGYSNSTFKDSDDDFESRFNSSNIGLNAGFSIFL